MIIAEHINISLYQQHYWPVVIMLCTYCIHPDEVKIKYLLRFPTLNYSQSKGLLIGIRLN